MKDVHAAGSPEQRRDDVESDPTTSVALPELSRFLEPSHFLEVESRLHHPATVLVVGKDPIGPIVVAFLAEGNGVLDQVVFHDEIPHGLVRIEHVLTK